MATKTKDCPACGKEVAKSAKVCPHCGKKLKMGMLLKIIIGIIILIILGAIFGQSKEEKAKEQASVLESLSSEQVSDLSPSGELALAFKLSSKFTDVQRDKIEKEITGNIVQWTLPIFEVNKKGDDAYRIQTKGNNAIMGGKALVGAFITVYPRNEEEMAYIEALKTDDNFTFKGKITGTTIRYIDIKPAVVIR